MADVLHNNKRRCGISGCPYWAIPGSGKPRCYGCKKKADAKRKRQREVEAEYRSRPICKTCHVDHVQPDSEECSTCEATSNRLGFIRQELDDCESVDDLKRFLATYFLRDT